MYIFSLYSYNTLYSYNSYNTIYLTKYYIFYFNILEYHYATLNVIVVRLNTNKNISIYLTIYDFFFSLHFNTRNFYEWH